MICFALQFKHKSKSFEILIQLKGYRLKFCESNNLSTFTVLKGQKSSTMISKSTDILKFLNLLSSYSKKK